MERLPFSLELSRRRARRNERAQALLPLSTDRLSNSISCWYCDFKIYTLNKLLFSFGQRHARLLRVWFSFGVVLSFLALIGVTMMLLLEPLGAFQRHNATSKLNNLFSWLFGISPLARGFKISVMDTCVMVFSTMISIAVHEFGHAIAAASEGIQIEYISIFLAIIFPGALVAFNYDLLQSLPNFAALRVYCAGIWHNLMFSTVCGFTMLMLPLILYPLYLQGEGPMVLEVPEISPLAGYLSHGDVIVSVDGSEIKNSHDWMEMMDRIHNKTLHQAISGRTGYCVPNPWIGVGANNQTSKNQLSCPDELAAFMHMSCSNSTLLLGNNTEGINRSRTENKHCLVAKDLVKLKKCWDGWQMDGTRGNHCECLEEESCMAPIQMPGMSWVEITYSSPYSSACLRQRKSSSSSDSEIPDYGSTPCGGTFVFIGDILSLTYSVRLLTYRPRWSFLKSTSFLPTILEKVLTCNFHISATLGLLNSLPVYYLDGESILEMGLCYITWLSRRRQRKVLRFCLIGGTILSVICILRILYFTFTSLK